MLLLLLQANKAGLLDEMLTMEKDDPERYLHGLVKYCEADPCPACIHVDWLIVDSNLDC